MKGIYKYITESTEEKKIFAFYNEETIRVYQAFNHRIADEALKLGKFGPSFKLDRMTWIKPSFLWMMYRSGWGTKIDQERILAIDITKEGFNIILSDVVLSTFNHEIYTTYDVWKTKLLDSQVRCQWDPDRDIHENPLRRRAIQLGLKGEMVKNYLDNWIVKINDITEYVKDIREEKKSKTFELTNLPSELEYLLEDNLKGIIGI